MTTECTAEPAVKLESIVKFLGDTIAEAWGYEGYEPIGPQQQRELAEFDFGKQATAGQLACWVAVNRVLSPAQRTRYFEGANNSMESVSLTETKEAAC